LIHPTDLLALFANLPQQAPINVQVVQPAPDSVGVRFLFAAIPSAFALGIAWIVFRWNGKREHEQWVRDQRLAEWREVLLAISEIELEIPVLVDGSTDSNKITLSILKVIPVLRSTVFVYSALQENKIFPLCDELVKCNTNKLSLAIRKEYITSIANATHCQDFTDTDVVNAQKWRDQCESDIRNKFFHILERVRDLAHRDLHVE